MRRPTWWPRPRSTPAASASRTCTSRWRTCSPSASPTPPSTWSTCTRCSSTSRTRSPPSSSCVACSDPEGVLAARDSDYGAFTWAPDDPVLDRWLELYLARDGAQRPRRPHRTPAPRPRPRGGVLRRDGLEFDLDLRRRRVTGLVGRAVGRPGALLALRRTGRRVRPERRRGARAHRRGVPALGGLATTGSSSSPTWRSWPAVDLPGRRAVGPVSPARACRCRCRCPGWWG